MNTSRQTQLKLFGDKVDDLVERFNAGLHATRSRDEIALLYRDLVFWLADVIQISPADARKPYLAYTDGLMDFAERLLSENSDGER